MHFDLRKLSYALAVERLGSFSLAAEELGLTQPTLSRSIAALEESWGIHIFQRTRSGVIATRSGAEMLREAAQLLASARTLDHNMRLRARALLGSIAFGMSGMTATMFMGKIMSMLSQVAPELKVTGKIEALASLLSDMRSDRIEFLIFADTAISEEPDITFERLSPVPVSFLVRAGHALDRGTAVSWSELGDFPLASSTPTRIAALPREPSILCDNCAVAKEVMLNSDTIWISSPWTIRSEIAQGRASELRISDAPSWGRAYLFVATLRNRAQSPAMSLIVTELKRVVEQYQKGQRF